VVEGSTLHVIGNEDASSPNLNQKAAPESERRTEVSMIAAVHSELSSVNLSIRPSFDCFIAALSSSGVDHALEIEHKRLGELLLQSLLRLDALVPEGQWTEARLERKKAVKDIQLLLDQLDAAWRNVQAS
jgi:hypothetical protein